MLSDNELWRKCIRGGSITKSDLGIGKYNNYPCNNCSTVYFCGNGDSCSKLNDYYKEREK